MTARKGLEDIIAASMVAVFIVLLFTGVGLTTRWGDGITEQRRLQSGFHTPLNSMEAARGYAAQALRYAEYQACHDLSAQGGQRSLESGIVAGGERLGLLADQKAFLGNLGQAMTEQFAAATAEPFGFVDTLRIAFPRSTVTAQEQAVAAKAEKNLQVSGSQEGVDYVLEREADVQLAGPPPCLQLHSAASALAPTARKEAEAAAEGALAQAVTDGLPAAGTVVKIGGVAVAAFDQRSKALGALAVLQQSGKEFSVFQEAYRTAVTKELQLAGAEASVVGGALALDHACSLALAEPEDTTGTAFCTLHYTAGAVAKVRIAGAEQFPIVVDGMPVLAPTALVFAVPATVSTRVTA